MKVSDYSFGSMKVGDKKISSDIIVHGDWIHDWWRESGHRVVTVDLKEIARRNPAIIVFGCGASGMMTVSAEAKQHLQQQGIDCETYNTGKAVKRYNQLLKEGKNVAGAFHLTC
ncbi:MAG: Mth938-like domain-containing protein [bacterium]